MKRFKEFASTAAPLTIVGLVLLVMFEVVDVSQRAMGWFVVSYLSLVLVLLTRDILRDFWRWVRGGGQ